MLQRFKSTNKILKLNSNHNILADPVEETLTPGEFKNPLVFWKLLVTSRIHVKLAQALQGGRENMQGGEGPTMREKLDEKERKKKHF